MSDVVIYDPDDAVVAGRVTGYLKSVNTPDYSGNPNTLVNPDLSSLSAVAQIYWKESSETIVEMTAGEKTDIDADLVPARNMKLNLDSATKNWDLKVDDSGVLTQTEVT